MAGALKDFHLADTSVLADHSFSPQLSLQLAPLGPRQDNASVLLLAAKLLRRAIHSRASSVRSLLPERWQQFARALRQSEALVSGKGCPSGSVVNREWRMGLMALHVYRAALVRLAGSRLVSEPVWIRELSVPQPHV